ncbi:hypothetical protein GF343_00725 [Candidatus Woesearchaeota archaeon]|nr:hypothetical protein [Candidatus Woesearchaeota archaeon]
MKFLEELKKLNFPTDQYAVFGSGPLAIRGLRENEDIEILVKPELWEKLAKNHKLARDDLISIGNVHIFKHWEPWLKNRDELIDTADIIDGIRFVKLEHVLDWKEKMGREKDKKDIELIEEYLMC